MSAMTYIQPHPKTKVYRIRRAIPEKARFAFDGKREFIKSLGTKKFKEAQSKAFSILGKVQRRIDNALAGTLVETDEQSFSMAIAFIEWDERNGGWGFIPHDSSPYIFDDQEHFLNRLKEYCVECGIPIDGNAFDELENIVECEINFLYEPSSTSPKPAPVAPVIQTTPSVSGGRKIKAHIKISELVEKFISFKNDSTNKVESEITKAFDMLIDIHGDILVTDVEMEHIREYRDLLLNYPVTGRTKKILALPIRQVADMKWDHTMSPKTLKKHLGYIERGFSYAVSEGFTLFNPAEGILIPKTTPTSRNVTRRELRPRELKTLFTSPLFNKCAGNEKEAKAGKVEIRDYRYWLPWVAFYSGARLAELFQLEKANLRQDGKIWYLEITTTPDEEDVEDKSLKTVGSKRNVPVHQVLIDKGFIAFAQKGKSPLIFPTKYKTPKNAAKVYSTWFGRYMGKVGLNDPGTVFHSSRHNFKSAVRLANIQKDVHDLLTGHSPQDIGGKYGKNRRLMDYLKEEIDKVEYEGID